MVDEVVGAVVGEFGGLLIPVLWLVVALVVALLLLQCVRALRSASRRRRAGADLGVRLPRGVRARPVKGTRRGGSFVLGYPRWRMARKDGTRNRRYRNNEVVEGISVLELGRWRLTSRSVFRFYDFVVALREHGHSIALSSEEATKMHRLGERAQWEWVQATSGGLHRRFADDPTQFEQFCAELYRRLGYEVEVTPPVADGGFDLSMVRRGERTLVECKCFGLSHPVGRPVLQKLYGANAVERADHLVLVTTAIFTREAVAYARQVGIELVDGTALTALCNRVYGSHPPTPTPTTKDAQLTREDHLANIPADIRVRYAAA